MLGPREVLLANVLWPPMLVGNLLAAFMAKPNEELGAGSGALLALGVMATLLFYIGAIFFVLAKLDLLP